MTEPRRPCPVCKKPVSQPKTGRRRIYDVRACRDVAWRNGTARDTRRQKAEALRRELVTAMRRSQGA